MTLRSISLSRGMRVGLPAVLLGLWTLLFLWRLFQAQIIDGDYYHEKAAANTTREQVEAPGRGTILWSNGEIAAADAPRYDLLIRTGRLKLESITLDQVRNMVQHTLPGERGDLRDLLADTLAKHEPFVAEVAEETGQDRADIARQLLQALESVERQWVGNTTAQPFLEGIARERWVAIKQRLEDPITPPVSNWRAVEAAVGSERTYPGGTLGAFILGTVKNLSGDEYAQLGRSGLAIWMYSRRQKWYAEHLKALSAAQTVQLGSAFGSLDQPPRPPAYIDEAVLLLRSIRANASGSPTSTVSAAPLSLGSTLWDTTSPGDTLHAALQNDGLEALETIADEPLVMNLSEGEKIWVGTDGYGTLRRYLPDDTVGSMGVELYYNDFLRGRHGLVEETRRARIERSADGEIQDDDADEEHHPAPGCDRVPGGTLQLTIDPNYQRAAEAALKKLGRPGVVILIDPHSGAVRALAVYPSFDPSAFAEHRNAEIESYIKDPDSPLLNRAISGLYAPGSTMKPVVSLGALKLGIVGTDFNIFCTGAVRNSHGQYMIGCDMAHGRTDVVHALQVSCNCFYHAVAQKWGIDGLAAWLNEAGLAHRTGIDLPFESTGFIPTPAWKEQFWHQKWLSIETSHVAIGQGSDEETPIQAAMEMCMVANGGKLIRPHVVDRPGADAIVKDLEIDPRYVQLVHQGLYECANEPGGTAYRTFHGATRLPFEVAGKTGTADVKKDGQHCVNSWFSGYEPADNPQLVFVAVVPFAPSGSAGGFLAGGLVLETLHTIFVTDAKH
ncbi:MAG: penicillin-binding transpeptidase domain-containing protein [Planctomycetota bacterium]